MRLNGKQSFLYNNFLCPALLWVILCLGISSAHSQELNSDQLFQKARIEAFENKNYPGAINIAKQALTRSPDYTDIQVFLGRLYTWSDQPDSARMVFQMIALTPPQDPDFYLAYGSLEYWEGQHPKALQIVNRGLSISPKTEDLLLLKAKILQSAKQYDDALNSLQSLLEVNPKNGEARDMLARLKNQETGHEIGINYNFMYFNTQFEDNWHVLGASYKRATPIGSFILRTNYANKFADNGVQFELEAYPRLSNLFYMYLGAGYSDDVGIFPKFRSGASLYANLPKSFEAEIGYRQLKFTQDIWMYTASIGKYYKNFWFNIRTYLTPDEDNISQSYAGTVRYYTRGADDYLGFIVGTGISPEENRENLFTDNPYKLKSFKAGMDYNFTVRSKNLFSITGTYYKVEYRPQTKDDQFDISLGYRRRF
ncbi:YaiO family outer membrane beta-barrel protein [Sphingobacterium sp. PU5-4]|uniref:YaiO family outer membrane beta-barrel protein n=1 Tax=Sphingobacterium tenebrionis TaxID=3111775 RepID=A0ABU8I1R7_9SPHI